mgnify:CR=1 FL=1
MEFIIGFIMGLILAQLITSTMYEKALHKTQSSYADKLMEIKRQLDEYNR